MAHDDARRRRERPPPHSGGGSEGYSDGCIQPYSPGIEIARRRGYDGDDVVEPASRPYISRSRVDSRSAPAAQYQRRRSLGRESSGFEPTTEGVVLAETPIALRSAASSDGEDDQEFARRGVYGGRFNSQNSDRGEPRPASVARDEIIIERRDEARPFEPSNPAVYADFERNVYSSRRPVSPMMEDIDTLDDFRFVFPAEESLKDAELSDLETPTTESESTQNIERPPSSISNAPGIYSSSYSGTAELGAQHDVNLTTLHDARGQKRPLFRWLPLMRNWLRADAFFQVDISRHIHFSDAERRAVGNLRAEVKRQCIKTRYSPQGAKVGYMEPRCIQSPIQPSNNKKPSESSHASWICIPYFCLQQYSESSSTSNTALFPAQTLLQSQYSRSSQQRDMDQAVCQLGQARRGECFHISQMWCLIVGNNRLLTADNWGKILKLAEGLKGDVMLKLKIEDVPDVPRVFPKPDAAVNEVPEKRLEQSEAPLEYLHVFTLLPKSAESSGDAVLKDLREQLSAAEKFMTEQTSYSAQRGYKKCGLMTRDGVHEYLIKLAARVEERAIDAVRRSYDERIDVFNMADMLFQLFFPLTFQGPTTGKYWGALSKLIKMPEWDGDDAVITIPAPIAEVKTVLWQLTRDIQPFQNIMSLAEKEDRAAIELPRELVTAWLHIVFSLIYSSHRPDWFGHMTKARSLMREGMQKIIQGISNHNLLDKAVMLPTEVMSLITLNLLQDDVGKYDDICDTYSLYLNFLDTAITTKPSNRAYQHRIDLVKQEMTAIKRNLARQRSIIAMLRNKTSISDGNFVVRYGEEMPTHMRRLKDLDNGARSEDAGLRRRAPGRRHHGGAQDRTIGPGVYDQDRIGVQFSTDLEAASKLSSTDAGGFRSLFLADCANIIEQREYEFRRNTEYAEDLERDIVYKMEWTKDKQENAIYAFTLVTIVFLPLSAISSIFGMNTKDIRNMDFDQWLYWVVAVPVTVIIIVAGLWWMGELGNTTDWLIGGRGRSSGHGGSSSFGAGASRPAQPVMDYDSMGRSSDETPAAYRPARYRHPSMRRSYAASLDMPPPRRRRTSFYKR
ncbi:mg2+ transporter [Trichoderma cornu-damae]|uniref:Mg2+ transporter n=1 Tax=Trichoderma cornu-damae TaxID=654480 RepID=A0A9P8QT44_9HYPO|nr:mg2+ transporter [Trichoderma cornu-damae]